MNLERLAWVDIETTGLDEHLDDILEIGVIITDEKLVEVARASWVLGDAVLVFRDEKVREMHRASELLAECEESELQLHHVDEEIFAFLEKHGALGSPMCGASVHFDRRFLRGMKFEQALHYRNFDVSVFRILAALTGVELPQKNETHRALADLEAAIRLARWALGRFRDVDAIRAEIEREIASVPETPDEHPTKQGLRIALSCVRGSA